MRQSAYGCENNKLILRGYGFQNQAGKLVSAKNGKKNFTKQFKINAKTGNVTVKKDLKKGTYNVKVKVKAAGSANYKASSWKSVTFKIRVR